MPVKGLNKPKQARLRSMAAGMSKITEADVKRFAKVLGCDTDTISIFLNVKKINEKDLKDDEIALLKSELNSSNEAIKGMQSEMDNLKNKNKFTGKQIWDIYAEAVGGKTFDGKPLPEYSKLGTQQKGWIAVVKLVNA